MQHILSARNRRVLGKFASAKVLLAFDFDGTLAPIVSDPRKAAPRPITRRLLQRLTSLYPCIVVSGRSRGDVRRKLKNIRFTEFIGNHGIEPWGSSPALPRLVKSWIPAFKQGLAPFGGVLFENKRFTLSVHYRRERNKNGLLKVVTDVVRGLPKARLIGGKQVVNIVPRGSSNKGRAVARARQQIGCDNVIYVGDDKTDESVFAQSRNKRYLTIRVGASRSSLARFYIRNQREIDRLLRAIIELHSDKSPGPFPIRSAGSSN